MTINGIELKMTDSFSLRLKRKNKSWLARSRKIEASAQMSLTAGIAYIFSCIEVENRYHVLKIRLLLLGPDMISAEPPSFNNFSFLTKCDQRPENSHMDVLQT